jgi:hypothetical protein
MAGDKPVIWVKTEAKCFSRKDWTIQIRLNCLNKSSFPRRRLFFSCLAKKTPAAPTRRKSRTTRQETTELFGGLRDQGRLAGRPRSGQVTAGSFCRNA